MRVPRSDAGFRPWRARQRARIASDPAARSVTAAWAIAALICAVVSLGLLWVYGNRLVFSNDEGIILDAAERMVHGQAPYRDFFTYMSPGSYWLQEGAFRLFGLNLPAGRVVVIFDFGVECALLFWLTARLAGRKAGFAATALFFAFQVSRPDYLLAQHRMDSEALSLLSIALCLEGRRRGAWYWLAAGVLAVAAGVCTPSMALLAPVTLVWLLAERPLRRFLVPYIGGLCAGAVAVAAALMATGSLRAFVEQMIWLRRNYSDVNVMPYGSLIGGYGAALGTATGTARVFRSLALFCIALPAVLPVVALAAWGLWMLLRRGERRWAAENAIPYLLACMAMHAVSTFPRSDVTHLAFVAVLPAALTAAWIVRYAPWWIGAAALAVLAVWGGIFLVQPAIGLRDDVALRSPVGTLHAPASDAQAVGALLKVVRPGDGLFVHPYMPVLYFLTQGRNPTRTSYLAPGLMTHTEEAAALDDLEKSPPRWLLYLRLSRAEFLRVCPHAGNIDERFHMIEDWREREYVPVEPAVMVAGYRLYERRAMPVK